MEIMKRLVSYNTEKYYFSICLNFGKRFCHRILLGNCQRNFSINKSFPHKQRGCIVCQALMPKARLSANKSEIVASN